MIKQAPLTDKQWTDLMPAWMLSGVDKYKKEVDTNERTINSR